MINIIALITVLVAGSQAAAVTGRLQAGQAKAIAVAAANNATAALDRMMQRRGAPVRPDGKCTIGIYYEYVEYPGGDPGSGAGANTIDNFQHGYIVGTDNRETDFQANIDGNNNVVSDGNYGGISGGYWHVQGPQPYAGDFKYCSIGFVDRTDHDDEGVDTRNAPAGMCAIRDGSGPFEQWTVCECYFDCQ